MNINHGSSGALRCQEERSRGLQQAYRDQEAAKKLMRTPGKEEQGRRDFSEAWNREQGLLGFRTH